jgi:hypothetical protein
MTIRIISKSQPVSHMLMSSHCYKTPKSPLAILRHCCAVMPLAGYVRMTMTLCLSLYQTNGEKLTPVQEKYVSRS